MKDTQTPEESFDSKYYFDHFRDDQGNYIQVGKFNPDLGTGVCWISFGNALIQLRTVDQVDRMIAALEKAKKTLSAAPAGDLKFCPACQAAGQKSRVYREVSYRTDHRPGTVYGEDGHVVLECMSTEQTHYRCSKDHRFSEDRVIE
jgi:hypothetical protein